MVKIRTLVPLSHPTTGEAFAAGVEVDVADEVAADWKADGKIALIADEQAEQQRASEGAYTSRTSREDAGGKDADEHQREKKK